MNIKALCVCARGWEGRLWAGGGVECCDVCFCHSLFLSCLLFLCVQFCLGHLNVLHLCFGMAWCVLLVLCQSGIVIDLYADMTWCLALSLVLYDLFIFVFVAFASDFTECVCQS